MSSMFRSGGAAAKDAKPAATSGTGSVRTKSPTGKAAAPAAPIQTEEESAKVVAWQNEMDSMEKKQLQIQADQMNLLHSQIHILTRELGDLQKAHLELNKKVDDMAQDIQTAQDEAHSALRLELAEHGNNAAEMKAAWEEAHKALGESMDTGLAQLAQEHVKALEDHAAAQEQALKDHAENHGNTVADIQAQLRGELAVAKDAHDDLVKTMDLKHGKHSEDLEKMEQGMRDVLDNNHDKLQQDIADLKSGHASNLNEILLDVTQRVDTVTLALEQEQEMRKGVEEKLDDMFAGLQKVMSGAAFAEEEEAEED